MSKHEATKGGIDNWSLYYKYIYCVE